ncbi:MAG: hypothetical protein WBM01_23855 [Mycobacterium sp.]|uniref:hypothetical protein n=1 Tax=Mycobacterium sp. TaxID=1785 RepID=UPI003C76A12F
MSRNARTPAPRRRRIALSFGMAAGAALIAASFSLGTAPVAGADVVDADPVSDLFGAADPAAVSAAGVSDTLALSYLVEAFDPNSFSSAGSPTDALGLLAYGLDTYLLGPTGIDAELAPLVQELVGTVTVGSPPAEQLAISDLIGALDPNAFTGGTPGVAPTDALGLLAYGLDTYLLAPYGIDNLLYPYVEDIIASLPSSAASVDVDPVSDLVLALDPSAFSAGVADLTAPTAAGLLDPVIDGLLNSGLSLF